MQRCRNDALAEGREAGGLIERGKTCSSGLHRRTPSTPSSSMMYTGPADR